MVDPIFIAIVSALAGKAAGSLFDVVRNQLTKSESDMRELDKFRSGDADADERQDLARTLQNEALADPTFAETLTTAWKLHLGLEATAGSGDVSNSVTGEVSGTSVQSRDIIGGIHF